MNRFGTLIRTGQGYGFRHHGLGAGRRWGLVVGLVLCAGCGASSPSILNPQGPAAAHITDLWWVLFWTATVVFVLVMGFLLLALFRRRGQEDEPARAEARYGTRIIVIAGIVLPALILLGVYAFTLTTLRALANPPIPEELTIHVIGRQWWWEVQYPAQQFATANEVHIPVGYPVRILLSSDNVIHSFWVPELHGKMDMIPGATNPFWLQADRAGVYWGECAEFCGVQHAKMNFLVIAHPPDEFLAWLEEQRQPAATPSDALAAQGEQVFLNTTCLQCHTIRGTQASGNLGPDLTHLASRRLLAAGAATNNIGNLSGWISDPQHIKPGNLMPPSQLSSTELRALVAYLATLK